MIENKLVFKDKKDNILYGYSQKNLDLVYDKLKTLNKLIKTLVIVIGILGFWFLLILTWLLWQVKKYHIITYFINNCKVVY